MKISKKHHVTKDGVVKRNPPKDETDLYLKELNKYYGTENYYNVMGVRATDGIMYVMNNGYSWVVTDAIVILKMKPKVRAEEFVVIKLSVKEGKNGKYAEITYDDGNGNILFRQKYQWTDAKRGFTMYYTGGVLMLQGEY